MLRAIGTLTLAICIVPCLSLLSGVEFINSSPRKEISLQLCAPARDRSSLPVPFPPSCTNLRPNQDGLRSMTTVYFWSIAPEKWSTRVCECSATAVTKTCETDFLNNDKFSSTEAYIPISYERCKVLCDPDKSKNILTKSVLGSRCTPGIAKPRCRWYSTVIDYGVVECTLTYEAKIDFMTGNLAGIMNTIGPCSFESGQCPTVKGGYVLWKGVKNNSSVCWLTTSVKEVCEYKSISGEKGTYSLYLHCPKSQTDHSLPANSPKFECGRDTIYQATQGTFLSLEAPPQLLIRSHAETMIAIGANSSRWALNKIRKYGLPDVTKSLITGQIGSELMFFVNALEHKMESDLHHVSNQLCRLERKMWRLGLWMSQLDSKLSADLLLPEPNPAARAAPGSVYTDSCIDINDYSLLQNDECSFSWPVSYSHKKGTFLGHVIPGDWQIKDKAVSFACNKLNSVLWPFNATHVIDLRAPYVHAIPFPSSDSYHWQINSPLIVKRHKLDALTGEISSVSRIEELFSENQQLAAIAEHLDPKLWSTLQDQSSLIEKKQILTAKTDFASKLLQLSPHGVFSTLLWVVFLTGAVVMSYILFKLAIFCYPQGKFLYTVTKCCFGCCCSIFKRKKKSTSRVRYNRGRDNEDNLVIE